MRIWFDLSNSPHINMFYDLIKELELEGHEIVITARPLANTVALLNQKELKFTIVGQHYGKNIFKKIFGFPIRVIQLVNFLKHKNINYAVSQSSFHSPLVAKIIGVSSLYTNDNEHALGNLPSFFFATKVLLPEKLKLNWFKRLFCSKHKILRYPGIKEGIYLWRNAEKIQMLRKANPNKEVHIYIRPEPQTAQYYKGDENFLDDLIIELQSKYKITILARNENQLNHYSQPIFIFINLPIKPIPLEEIAIHCTLFIGAGGSMTREMALLGVPTISVYQDNLLEVDQLLIDEGLMWHEMKLTAHKTDEYLHNLTVLPNNNNFIETGKQAYQILKKSIV